MAMKMLFALSVQAAAATQLREGSHAAANPIRKVVNMLQMMQKKVEAEAAKADELFDKYMCYCKTGSADLEASISAAEGKVPQLEASIEAAEGKLAQLKKDVKSHQSDRAAAETAMKEATAIREKEKAAFDKALADSKTNLAAVRKAVAALEKGAAGSFVQTSEASVLRGVVRSSGTLAEADREDVMAFLSGGDGAGYAPQSGEVTGILKAMGDEMAKDQEEMIATEDEAVKTYEGLMASKKKEVAALSKSIEEKLARISETGVAIETMKGDLDDTSDGLLEDKKFLKDLEKNCATKADVHEEEKKMRAQEVVALADTIKILNDDDALDLFNKVLPKPGASFMQLQVTSASMRQRAREVLAQARSLAPAGVGRERLDFIGLALRGKKVGFEKVTKLIDNLVASLKQEQVDDDSKMEYCKEQFDLTEDKTKELKRSLADLTTVIEETKEGISTTSEDIELLQKGIKALDRDVAEATAQRKDENAEYKDLMTSNTAAKELILFAKNRLQKFYNPKLYKAPPKAELSAGDRIYENNGGEITTEAPGGIAGTGISAAAFVQLGARRGAAAGAPPPPPATAAAYTKKSEESGGVMAMMDLLVADLDKEMTVAETEEKAAQKAYEAIMVESADKRAQDSKSLTDKEAAKAEMQSTLETSQGEKKSTTKELMATEQYMSSLHGECDWLMQYHSVRKQARTDEIDSLEKAKAVLAGADFSLLQTRAGARAVRTFLRRTA